MAQLIYEAIKQLELFNSGCCTFAHVWRVSLELFESELSFDKQTDMFDQLQYNGAISFATSYIR